MINVPLHLTQQDFWPWIAATTAGVVLLVLLFELNAGVRQLSLRRRRRRFKYGHASALLYSRLVRPNLIKLSNGAFLAMYEMAAPDASVYDDNGLAAADFGIAKAVSQFNDHMVVHMHQRNAPYSEYDGRETRIRIRFSSGSTGVGKCCSSRAVVFGRHASLASRGSRPAFATSACAQPHRPALTPRCATKMS